MLCSLDNLKLTLALTVVIGCATAVQGCGSDDTVFHPATSTAGNAGAAGSGNAGGAGAGGTGGAAGSAGASAGGSSGASGAGTGGASGAAGAAGAGGAGGAAGTGGAAGSGGSNADSGSDVATVDAGSDVSIDVSMPDAMSTDDGASEAADGSTPESSVNDDASDATISDAAIDVFDGPTCPGATPSDAGDDVAQGGGVFMPTNCGAIPLTESPSNAFDNDVTTKFLCFLQNRALPTIEYRFPAGATYAVNAYTVTSANDAQERDPQSWRLEGSNDDGTTWTVVDAQFGQTFAFRQQTNTYTFSNCVAYARYRFVVTELSGGDASTAAIFQVAEIRLFGPQGHAPTLPPNRTKGGTVTTPSTCGGTNPRETPPFAFDSDFGSKWFCGGNTTPAVEIRLDSTRTITAYSVTSGNDNPDRDPKSWILEGTNDPADAGADASTWFTVDIQVNQTFANRNQTVNYSVPNPIPLSRYRFRVTANAGSVDTQVSEIMLFGN